MQVGVTKATGRKLLGDEPMRKVNARSNQAIARRMESIISSSGSSMRIPISAHSSSGALSAALAWLTGSAPNNPPLSG